MSRILVPIAGSANDRFALQDVVRRFMNDTTLEVHLLHVQAPFSAHVARFASSRNRQDYHHEMAEKALTPAREVLGRHGVPYAEHVKLGDRALHITGMARQLQCEAIVMAVARKNSLTRWVESSVTDRVLELTTVPVEIVAGDSMSPWERYGIPAALGAALLAALTLDG